MFISDRYTGVPPVAECHYRELILLSTVMEMCSNFIRKSDPGGLEKLFKQFVMVEKINIQKYHEFVATRAMLIWLRKTTSALSQFCARSVPFCHEPGQNGCSLEVGFLPTVT